MPEQNTQRVRDPIHGLIDFKREDVEVLCWQLVQTREFQRLRRIKQLGFSELIYPCATHNRLSHSLGVFHNARRLLEIAHARTARKVDPWKRAVVLCASLLHDVGHGPFSHAFENAMKGVARKDHEQWGGEIIRGDTDIAAVLDKFDPRLKDEVASLLLRDPADMYDSVVHSQFDADRLDYVRRDRYMTGIGAGAIDSDWLMDCLDVGSIFVGAKEDGEYTEVEGFFLTNKGFQAAEAYLLARYQLYGQVYYHKTTRAAEKMLTALLSRVTKEVIRDGGGGLGLNPDDVLVRFISDSTSVPAYLSLDDAAIWATICKLAGCADKEAAKMAARLRDRQLYKCLDVGALADGMPETVLPKFKAKLKREFGGEWGWLAMDDSPTLSAYSRHDADEAGAWQKVLIGSVADGEKDDIARRSPIVRSIEKKTLYRVYAADSDVMLRVLNVWKDVAP